MKYDNLLELEKDYTRLLLESASIVDCCITLVFSRLQRGNDTVDDGIFSDRESYPLIHSAPFLKICFDLYTTCAMHNESYFYYNDDGDFEGGAFKRSTESSYLNYVRSNSWVEDMHDNQLVHYRILTSDEFVDVITCVPPKITLIQQMVMN